MKNSIKKVRRRRVMQCYQKLRLLLFMNQMFLSAVVSCWWRIHVRKQWNIFKVERKSPWKAATDGLWTNFLWEVQFVFTSPLDAPAASSSSSSGLLSIVTDYSDSGWSPAVDQTSYRSSILPVKKIKFVVRIKSNFNSEKLFRDTFFNLKSLTFYFLCVQCLIESNILGKTILFF